MLRLNVINLLEMKVNIVEKLMEKQDEPFFQDIVYSITKTLVMYKPNERLSVLGQSIEANKSNLILKRDENRMFNSIIYVLDSLNSTY